MDLAELDILILRAINQPFSSLLNLIFIGVTYSVYFYLMLLAFVYFRRKEKLKLTHLSVASVTGTIFVYLLKYLIARPRPFVTYSDINKILFKLDPSFPSSHTFISFLCFTFLPKGMPKWFTYLSIIYLLVLIPVGSMYTGIHYPSDVLAGAVLGLVFPKILSEKITIKLSKKLF